MKRKMSNKERLKRSNMQHIRLYGIYYQSFLHKVPSDDGYVDALVKMNYHNDVYNEQGIQGRVLTLQEKKQVFSHVKKSFEKTKDRLSRRW